MPKDRRRPGFWEKSGVSSELDIFHFWSYSAEESEIHEDVFRFVARELFDRRDAIAEFF